jgi:hypothetical protein
MFVKVGRRILNTDQIVEVIVSPPEEAHTDEEGDFIDSMPLAVDIYFCANYGGFSEDSGFMRMHKVHLAFEEAELFLAALPVYTPALEGS